MDNISSQQNDTALLYQYIKTLQMENLRRNQQRIYLQSEIQQMRLHINAMEQEYSSPIQQINFLKNAIELLKKQNMEALENISSQKRRRSDTEIQLKAFRQQNQKLKQMYQKAQRKSQRDNSILKYSICNQSFERQKQRTVTSLMDRCSVNKFRLQKQEQERMRFQIQQATNNRFQQKRSQQIKKLNQQQKLAMQKLNKDNDQVVLKLKKQISQCLQKNQMTQKTLNQINVKYIKLQRMQAMVPQITETLKLQKIQKQRYKMKLNEERQLSANLKGRIKTIELQNKKLRQQLQQQLQASESNSKRAININKLQQMHLKQKQELEFENERLLDQVAKSKQELRQNYQFLQREKQAIVNKSRDNQSKLKIQINLLKFRIQKLQRDFIDKSKQLQATRQQNIENMKALQGSFAQKSVRGMKQLQNRIDELGKIIEQKDRQILFIKNQFEQNSKYTETLQESHKKLRVQILNGVNRVSRQRQFLQQIRNLKKQNNELKIQSKSRNNSISGSNNKTGSIARATRGKLPLQRSSNAVNCSKFNEQKIFKISLNGDNQQATISTIQCNLGSMRSSNEEASFIFANSSNKKNQNVLQNILQRKKSHQAFQLILKNHIQQIDSPAQNDSSKNSSDQKVINSSQKKMKKITGVNEDCQNQKRSESPKIFGALKQRIQKLRENHYLDSNSTLAAIPLFQNIENIDKNVQRFYSPKNQLKKIRN